LVSLSIGNGVMTTHIVRLWDNKKVVDTVGVLSILLADVLLGRGSNTSFGEGTSLHIQLPSLLSLLAAHTKVVPRSNSQLQY
jgi:hypothetical protein